MELYVLVGRIMHGIAHQIKITKLHTSNKDVLKQAQMTNIIQNQSNFKDVQYLILVVIVLLEV